MPDLATLRNRKKEAATTGPRLRRARLKLKLSQREIAERAGVSQPLLCMYEGGKVMPPEAVLARLWAVLQPVAE